MNELLYQKIEKSFCISETSDAIATSLGGSIEYLCSRISKLDFVPDDVKETMKRIYLIHCDLVNKNIQIKDELDKSLKILDSKDKTNN